MYSAIGSYMMRAWSLFDFRFHRHPPLWAVTALGLAIYVNFFSHHFVPDTRLPLIAATFLVFGRSWIFYRVHHRWRGMPMVVAALLAAVFIWIGENIGTFSHVWLYPSQRQGWTPVGPEKLEAWFLLQISSYALVARFMRPKTVDDAPIAESIARHERRLGAAE